MPEAGPWPLISGLLPRAPPGPGAGSEAALGQVTGQRPQGVPFLASNWKVLDP